MASDSALFAGVDLSSGRKPFTFAALDDGLNIAFLSQWDLGEVLACLNDYSRVQLTINVPGSKTGQKLYSDLRKKLGQAGFTPHIKREGDLRWSETKAEDCFRAFQSKLFPRRTLEGRIQRSLILHEEGVQLTDPMDYYEEITRYKLLQGVLPAENIHSVKELDALAAAYVSWMTEHRAGRIAARGELILPVVTDGQ